MIGLKNPTMLYRKGTMEKLHGVFVDYTVVDEDEVDMFLEDGWFLTPTEVKEAEDAAKTKK